MKLFEELKRRNVFRVAGVYAVVAWLLVQVVVAVEAPLSLPAWTDTLVIVLFGVGFPIAMILAWAFEMTPEGVKLTANVAAGESIHAKTGRKLDYAILAGIGLIAVMFVVDRVAPSSFETAASRPRQDEESSTPHLEEASRSEAVSQAASIAVLPFADLSPGKDQEYFSDGMAEEILNVLAKVDVRTQPRRGANPVSALLIPLGDFSVAPYPLHLWGADYARYRRSPQFKAYIRDSGVYDYWRAHGFPPQCKPKGPQNSENADFECA